MNIENLLRPEVKNFEPYLPGKSIEELRRELGLKKIIKLASNENANGASKLAIQAIEKKLPDVFRYPDGSGTALRRALAGHLRVNEKQVVLGAGSDEIIELLGKTFFNCGDEIIVSQHAFIRYQMAADLMGAKTIAVPMKDHKHDLKAMAKKINRKTKALFIANPNNPTGTYVNKEEVKQFFSQLSNSPTPLLIFDEAYYEFSKFLKEDYPETIDYFREKPNVLILRTFSKIYGLAGLRVGYGIAREPIVGALDRVRPPFNVSNVAQAAAIAALSDRRHIQRSVQIVKEGMSYLVPELEEMGLSVLPSAGNFIMVDLSPLKGKEVFLKLLKKGVIVRAIEEYGFPCHIRVTVGFAEENRTFIQKLKEVLKEP